tara:strand:+ start:230 stop:361 length:132 start_codon:yes stop_codon:yes gene_type:complete
MKKIIFALLAIGTLALASCTKTSAEEETKQYVIDKDTPPPPNG